MPLGLKRPTGHLSVQFMAPALVNGASLGQVLHAAVPGAALYLLPVHGRQSTVPTPPGLYCPAGHRTYRYTSWIGEKIEWERRTEDCRCYGADTDMPRRRFLGRPAQTCNAQGQTMGNTNLGLRG